jgi:hypothetical protein
LLVDADERRSLFTKCMGNADRSRADASHMAELAARVRAAHYHIERGLAARGIAHLRRNFNVWPAVR